MTERVPDLPFCPITCMRISLCFQGKQNRFHYPVFSCSDSLAIMSHEWNLMRFLFIRHPEPDIPLLHVLLSHSVSEPPAAVQFFLWIKYTLFTPAHVMCSVSVSNPILSTCCLDLVLKRVCMWKYANQLIHISQSAASLLWSKSLFCRDTVSVYRTTLSCIITVMNCV